MSASKGYYRDELVKLIKEARADGVTFGADYGEIFLYRKSTPFDPYEKWLTIDLDDLDADA